MTNDVAWTPIPAEVDDYEQFWTPFTATYSFNPRYIDGRGGIPQPGINEPPGSVTFSLAPITRSGSEAMFCAGAQALNAEVLRAFVAVFEEDERLVVLDWQHQSYWFRPHLQATGGLTGLEARAGEWLVTPFPDGDYYVFLSEDLRSGTFGHPWEESLCVFGASLVDALAPTLSSWLPVLRRKDASVGA